MLEDNLSDLEIEDIEDELIDVDIALMTIYDEVLHNNNRSGYVHYSDLFIAWQERRRGRIEVRLFKIADEFISFEDVQIATTSMPGVCEVRHQKENNMTLPIKGVEGTCWYGDYPCIHFVVDLNKARKNEAERLSAVTGD